MMVSCRGACLIVILSPYLAAGIISARECIRATIELSGGKSGKVDASRDTGVGRWVQEIGRNVRSILLDTLTIASASLEGLLHSRPGVFSPRVDGQTFHGEICRCEMGNKRETFASLEGGPHGRSHCGRWYASGQYNGLDA